MLLTCRSLSRTWLPNSLFHRILYCLVSCIEFPKRQPRSPSGIVYDLSYAPDQREARRQASQRPRPRPHTPSSTTAFSGCFRSVKPCTPSLSPSQPRRTTLTKAHPVLGPTLSIPPIVRRPLPHPRPRRTIGLASEAGVALERASWLDIADCTNIGNLRSNVSHSCKIFFFYRTPLERLRTLAIAAIAATTTTNSARCLPYRHQTFWTACFSSSSISSRVLRQVIKALCNSALSLFLRLYSIAR